MMIMMITMMKAATATTEGQLRIPDGDTEIYQRSARRVEYDFHVASRGFRVVPTIIIITTIIIIIIMYHEHPRGPMGDPGPQYFLYIHTFPGPHGFPGGAQGVKFYQRINIAQRLRALDSARGRGGAASELRKFEASY